MMFLREKSKLVEECRQLIFQTKQMERSLSDSDVEHDHDEDEDQITAPLSKCLQSLKEKHKLVKRRHAERYESIKSEFFL
jgi:protein regulator of cytokinesis 1